MSRSAPIVLARYVRWDRDVFLGSERPAARPLSCVSRRVIGVGCSRDADNMLNNLHLETHLADAPALSRLTLGGQGSQCMKIVDIDHDLVVFASQLPLGGQTVISYSAPQVYLVYDPVEQSITMIPAHPWSLVPNPPGEIRQTADAIRVLIARPPGPIPGGRDVRRYALVTMAETTIYYKAPNNRYVKKLDVLYIWRPWLPRRWEQITTEFPAGFKGDDVPHSYLAVLAFSCGTRAFWVNLLRGIIYCSLDALLSASTGGPRLEFHFMSLPAELPPEITSDRMCAMEMHAGMFRTMGRVGESSIKFVCIDGFVQLHEFVKCTLRVWSLSPEHDMTSWTERSLCLESLVEQDEFRKANLPTDMVPMYPGLDRDEEDVIYFMLGRYDPCCNMHSRSKQGRCKAFAITAGKPMYHLRVDMRRGVLLGSARFLEPVSPTVIFANASALPSPVIPTLVPRPLAPYVVPSTGGSDVGRKGKSMVQRGSDVGRKCKRNRHALTS